jgi:UDP-N-acetylglucosamine--N-acetylmuramyl-(pentapeptide) pyrophosphoryl-undecaprenol N-acetylglucosamine transferase
LTVVMAAGGTGGHLIPAIVVADEISNLEPEAKIIFLGTGKELEKKILSSTPYQYEALKSLPFIGQEKKGIINFFIQFIPSVVQARKFLRSCSARVVVGFGGYPSVIPVIAAYTLGIPRIIVEQNGQAGNANKVLSKVASHVFAVPGAKGLGSRVHRISNPVKKAILSIEPWKFPAETEPLRILVLGGSQGAVRVNSAVISILDLAKKYPLKITHQTGEKDFPRVQSAYQNAAVEAEIFPYIEDMMSAYERAHLIICRAGATSVAEIIACKRPAIFIPLAISHGHQFYNIKELVAYKAAIHIAQNENLDDELRGTMEQILSDRYILQSMVNSYSEYFSVYPVHDSAHNISNLVLEILK